MPDPVPPKKPQANKRDLTLALLKVMGANLASPFSDRKADEWASSAMDEYGAKGGDISRHATAFGMAGAGGAIGGEAAISALPMVRAGAGASKAARVGLRAAEGAVQNAGASVIGSAMEGQGGREAMQRALVSSLVGAGIGGGVGALGRGQTPPSLMRPSRTPMDPQDVNPLEYLRPTEDRMTRPVRGGSVVGHIQPKPDIQPMLNLRNRAGFANPTGRPVPPHLRETAVTDRSGASADAGASVVGGSPLQQINEPKGGLVQDSQRFVESWSKVPDDVLDDQIEFYRRALQSKEYERRFPGHRDALNNLLLVRWRKAATNNAGGIH